MRWAPRYSTALDRFGRETMGVTTVYLLYHQGASDPPDDALLLGVYSTRERAETRIKEAVTLPGFRDYPNDFDIVPIEVDKDDWTQGFAPYEYVIEDSTNDGE